ncbi:MAG: hypothetical protein JNN00_13255 [Chitinophagaceae bacterium]|nr:hypothetical protein [Chitinophagaceae bacterium]
MKSILKAATCLCVITSLTTGHINAQLFNDPKFQFGIGVGTFVYQGDLTPSALGSYKTMKPAINLFAARLINSSFAWRANLAFGGLKGDDAKYANPEYRQQRNFNFTSRVFEIAGMAEWNILGRNYISRGFAPYVFGGVGYNFVNISRDYSNLNAEYFGTESDLLTGLTTDAQRSLPKGLLLLPVGVGTRYYLSDRIGISAETSYRIMSNDYLDGFSQAANPNKGDHYYSHTLGIVYRIGKKNTLGCPAIKY